jgi:hypothetical protein
MRTLAITGFVTLATAAATSVAMGQALHAIDSDRNYYTIDRASGGRSLRDTFPEALGTPGGLAFHVPSGRVFISSLSADAMFIVDEYFGGIYFVGSFMGASGDVRDIEWNDANNTMYGVSDTSLYTISVASGAATLVASTGISGITALAHDMTNDVMYMVSASTDSLYSVDLETGTATLVGTLNGPTSPSALAYVLEDDTLYLLCGDTNALYSVDRATGVATFIGDTGPGELVGLVWLFDPDATSCPPCTPDYDNNGGVDGGDLAAFFADFEAGAPCADVDFDGGVTGADMGWFMDCFERCAC